MDVGFHNRTTWNPCLLSLSFFRLLLSILQHGIKASLQSMSRSLLLCVLLFLWLCSVDGSRLFFVFLCWAAVCWFLCLAVLLLLLLVVVKVLVWTIVFDIPIPWQKIAQSISPLFCFWIGLHLLSCEDARKGCHLQHSCLVVAMVASVVALVVVLWISSTTYRGSCSWLLYLLCFVKQQHYIL